MVAVKVWLSGEGASDLGDRDKPNGQRQGALEAMLLRVEPHEWLVGGAIQWMAIRKYQAGAARGKAAHEDERNVLKLALIAKEAGCEVVAFSRDIDADREREGGIEKGIERAKQMFDSLTIIGGAAKPALEGWILALLGERDTDSLSRKRTNELLAKQEIAGKRAEDYVAIIERADFEGLPPGCDSLQTWLKRAKAGLSKAIRG
jgi:hypothetical protein